MFQPWFYLTQDEPVTQLTTLKKKTKSVAIILKVRLATKKHVHTCVNSL